MGRFNLRVQRTVSRRDSQPRRKRANRHGIPWTTFTRGDQTGRAGGGRAATLRFDAAAPIVRIMHRWRALATAVAITSLAGCAGGGGTISPTPVGPTQAPA